MNKRYLAVVLISMTLLFASVQAFDYFEFNKQLFPEYIPNKEPVIASFASSCSVTGTPETDCSKRYTSLTCETDNCCYWINPNCFKSACNTLNNPDVCAGCNTCSDLWTITNARGNTPWNIIANGGIEVNAGGSIRVHGFTLDAGSHGCKTSETSSIRISSTGTLKC